MIITRQDLKDYLQYERKLYNQDKNSKQILKKRLFKSKILRYVQLLRYCEYYYNNSQRSIINKFIFKLLNRRRLKLGSQLGYEIGLNIFGRGLHIYHSGVLITNGTAKVGENCTIIGTTCLGSKDGGKGPTIGDNCELGMNSIVIGEISIANNVHIGAGAVVVKSIYDEGVSIGGVPAKILSR